MNARHRARKCRLCVEACPVDALSLPPDKSPQAEPVLLDAEACVGCGLCLNVCPTAVFAQPESPESTLLSNVMRASGEAVELACPRKESPEESRVPGASVVLVPRCLAALAVPRLLELTATGKQIWLNDSLCDACPIGEARPHIQAALDSANRWLEALAHTSRLHSYLTTPDGLIDEPVLQPTVRGELSVMSRRDFFRSFGRPAGQARLAGFAPDDARGAGDKPSSMASSSDTWQGASGRSAGRGLAHHIPAQRQHLAAVLRHLAPDTSPRISTAGLPIADVIISHACTACGLCAQFCPTQAISFVSDDEYYVLNFAAALCLGDACGLCVIGCPADAVCFGEELTIDELLSTQVRPIRAGRLAPCAECGALRDVPLDFDAAVERPLCYICQARPQRADLLSGAPHGRTPDDQV